MISAYLDARSDVEDAVARLAILEVGRRDLAEHGAPDGLLPAIDAAAEQGHTGGDALGVLASSVGVLRVSLPDPPATDVALVALLPMGVPVLERAGNGPSLASSSSSTAQARTSCRPSARTARRARGGG